MFRLVAFRNGGTVEFDKNPDAVPTSVVNELITKEFLETSRLSSQAQIRLGKSGEYTARINRNSESDINVVLIFPVSLHLIADPDVLVSDVSKLYTSVAEDDADKFAKLVDLRLKSSIVKPTANTTASGKTQTRETEEKPSVKSVAAAAAAAAAAPEKIEPKNEAAAKLLKSKKAAGSNKKGKSKKGRTWDGNVAGDDDSDVVLDYSEVGVGGGNTDSGAPVEQLDALDLGTQSRDGFIVKELTDELGDILGADASDASSQRGSSGGPSFGFLKRFTGGKKLEEKDLQSVLSAMEDHLVQKNVAKEVAAAICEGVGRDLLGKSTKSWTTVNATVRESLKSTLSRILTPATSSDLLASIRKRRNSSETRPYVISVVGVNGVGKSTNLGKLGFWFLQNDLKVLVAACDTFRSGAVEQLKVHVQRLKQLKGRSSGDIELFDQGYGKDAAVIAKRAVEYGTKNHFDVVLIDTAGRRHNDDRLMSSLEKFGDLAQPDKIIMVGEALVGTDSVEQARNFDAAFGKSRGLDFFLISKCDTVGEMLGTLVNVTYATGVPVLFVGVGQQYTDLRTLSVDWAVDKLLA